MEKDHIKISEYANRMSIHPRTVYRHFHNGELEGYQDEERLIKELTDDNHSDD